jgi:hypothetical protein
MHKISENNYVHELGLHLIFCTKYRKPIFTGVIEIELREILGQTCTEYAFILISGFTGILIGISMDFSIISNNIYLKVAKLLMFHELHLEHL